MTDWEDRYQSGQTPWEKGAPHPALVEFIKCEAIRGRVLVPGCGHGHDVRAIAATADEVIGLDISPSAIRAAKQYPQVGGERFEVGDFFAMRPAYRGAFDWVFEHTCFCAIPVSRRVDYVDASAGALRQGGHLLAVFFLNPEMDPGESGPPFGADLAELDALFGGKFTLVREWQPKETHPGREMRELCRLMVRK